MMPSHERALREALLALEKEDLVERILQESAAVERAEKERDLALKALGFDSYEAAQQHITDTLRGPAPADWASR